MTRSSFVRGLLLLLLVAACVPADTTEEVVAVVDTALGSACNEVEPLALDLAAAMPSTERQDALPTDHAICYMLENPCPGWLAVEARPLDGGSLQLDVHEGFDPQLGRGQVVEESRSHHFELQAIHTYLDAHAPSLQVIRVNADAARSEGDTAFSLWVAFLPRGRRCVDDPPEAGDGPHRSPSHGRSR